MKDKTYSLNKNEADRLSNILSVARIQEEMLNAITLSYRAFLIEEVFKRLSIDTKDFERSKVNLQTGELVITAEPPTKPENKEEAK